MLYEILLIHLKNTMISYKKYFIFINKCNVFMRIRDTNKELIQVANHSFNQVDFFDENKFFNQEAWDIIKVKVV